MVGGVTRPVLFLQHAAATLGSGNLRLAVQLPEGEDMNEWVAVNSELLFVIKILVCFDNMTHIYSCRFL